MLVYCRRRVHLLFFLQRSDKFNSNWIVILGLILHLSHWATDCGTMPVTSSGRTTYKSKSLLGLYSVVSSSSSESFGSIPPQFFTFPSPFPPSFYLITTIYNFLYREKSTIHSWIITTIEESRWNCLTYFRCCQTHDACYRRINRDKLCTFPWNIYTKVYKREGCAECGMRNF